MPIGNWNLPWLTHNGQRSYPLTADASKRDSSDTITIPDDFIVGLYFPVHAGLNVEPHKFYLRELGVYATGYNIAIGYADGTAAPPLAAAVNIAKSTHSENASYALAGVGDFDDSVGKIVIGRLEGVDALPPGHYRFTAAAGAIEPDAIRPLVRGISSIIAVSATGDRSARLYGDVELVAASNFRITASQAAGAPAKVVFSAVSGEGLNAACDCAETSDDGPAIKTINGIPPLPDGNFRLVGDDCISMSPISHGVRLTDRCSTPCCGCAELQAVLDQIDRFADGETTLRAFANNLNSEVTQFHQVVLGSRLSDQGCTDNC